MSRQVTWYSIILQFYFLPCPADTRDKQTLLRHFASYLRYMTNSRLTQTLKLSFVNPQHVLDSMNVCLAKSHTFSSLGANIVVKLGSTFLAKSCIVREATLAKSLTSSYHYICTSSYAHHHSHLPMACFVLLYSIV